MAILDDNNIVTNVVLFEDSEIETKNKINITDVNSLKENVNIGDVYFDNFFKSQYTIPEINFDDIEKISDDIWDIESNKIVATVKVESTIDEFKSVKYNLNGEVLETYYLKSINGFDQKIKNLWKEEYFQKDVLISKKNDTITDIYFLTYNDENIIKEYNLNLDLIHGCNAIYLRYSPEGDYIGCYYVTDEVEKTLKDYFKNNTEFVENVLNFYKNQNKNLTYLIVKDFGNKHISVH